MSLEQQPFRSYHLNKQVDSFTVRLNDSERGWLEEQKKIIQQKKDSTAIKQLALIGSYVLHDQKTAKIIELLFKNKANNKRSGIVEFEQE